jgi:BirA family biotin operon repressor/biotin-[acetyl-CoA-carboxylase] ligase
LNFNLLSFDSLDSTNTEALKQARAGAPEGLCVVARHQTAGRGRHGRTWISERDAGLYFSLVLRPKLETKDLPLITLMTGVAVHDTLVELGLEPDIKWVNDLLVGDKKIAGILAETTDTPDGLAVVVGIGINLRSNYPPELSDTATSISELTHAEVDGSDLAEKLTRNLDRFYELLKGEDGPAAILREWGKRSTYGSGKAVRVSTGDETITGITDGLEPNGALRVRRGDGTIAIIQAGDVERLRENKN